ncbi:MAG: T9SS type A sorting domain-containing protein [Bacteroidia bacterium]|nr:T9SS type A sorting domain-containing protein [Bacteroidia bacterium]
MNTTVLKAQCTTGSNSPTGTFTISPYVQTLISTNMFPGSYVNIYISTPGEYEMAASFSSYFTVTDALNNPLAFGNNSLYYYFPTVGNYRLYLHSNSSCGMSGGSRIVAMAPRNNAFSFDGVDDYIDAGMGITNYFKGKDKLTLEAWVYPTQNTVGKSIIGNHSVNTQFDIQQAADKYIFFIGFGTYAVSTATGSVMLNTWQHIAAVFDDNVIKIYLNGVLSGTTAVPSSYVLDPSCAIPLMIGKSGFGGEQFQGSIDEVRIWDVARTQCEINTYKSGPIATSTTGLVANYHFNHGVAGGNNAGRTSLVDATGNGYNGTVTNAALSGATSNWVVSGSFANGTNEPTYTAPNVTISGTSTICSGNTTTLTASGVSTYTWVSGPTTSTIAVTPSVSTTYSVTGTNSVGCVSNMATKLVTVNTTPTISVNSGSICSGTSFTITPSGASTYTIQGGSAVVSPTANSTYTVVGTSSAGCVSANTATSNVTVNTTPTVSVNSGSICSGTSFTITPSGASTYTIQGGSAVVSPTATANYTVVGTSSAGCISNVATSNVAVNICTPAAALNFDGSDDYVSIPNSINMGDFTIEFWMNTTMTGLTGSQWYYGNGLVDGEVGGVTNDMGTALVGSKVGFGIGNPDITIFSTSNVNTGSWTHVAATWNKATGAMKLYINGIQEASATSTGLANRTTPSSLKIGVLNTMLRYSNVSIDDVRLWNTVRTQCEINTYMNAEIPTNATGLVANYHFNQGNAAVLNTGISTLLDATSNTNNGTLTNFALNGATSNWIAPGGVVSGYTTTLASPTVAITGTTAICSGNSAILTANGTVDTYTWSTTANTASISVTPTMTTTYSVSGTNSVGCVSNMATQTLTVNTTPTVSVNSGTICSGTSFTITPSGASTYTIQGGSAVVSPTATANYTVVGTSSAGCISSNVATSNVVVNICTAAAALNFDGSDDYVDVGTGLSTYFAGKSNITAEAWIYPTSNTGAYKVIVGNYNTTSNGKLQFLLRQDLNDITFWVSNSTGAFTQATATNVVTLNTWQHVAGTWDGSVIKVYVNGILKGSTNWSGTLYNTPNNVYIGANNFTNERFQGSIDEIRIWDVTRTQCEINTYMNAEIPTNATSLVANYHFNQGNNGTLNTGVTTLLDATSNAYNGTLTNFALNGATSNWIAPGGVVSGYTTTLASPTVAITGTTAICSGNSAILTANGTVDTYTWSTTANTASISVTPTMTTTYSVSGTNSVGCVSNMATQTLTVNMLPTLTVSATSNTICAGTNDTLAVTGASTYMWDSNAGSSMNDSVVVAPTSNMTYTVNGTDANGCSSSASINVNVNMLPTLTVSATSNTVCTGTNDTLIVTGASTYMWDSNAGSSMNDSVVVAPTSNMTYTVNGTDANGCSSSASINVSVNMLPTLTVSATSNTICTGTNDTLVVTGASTYMWDSNAGSSMNDSVVVAPTATTSTNMTYTVNGTDANGCSNTGTVSIMVDPCASGIKSSGNMVSFNVYPNPNTGVFTITASEELGQIHIYDMLGKMVYAEKSTQTETTINLSDLKAGIYYVTIKNTTVKIVKQ